MCEKDPDKICNCCVIDCETDTEINFKSDDDQHHQYATCTSNPDDQHNHNDASAPSTIIIKKRDLFNSPSWFDSSIALGEIRKGKASGNKAALIIRKKFQRYFNDCGCFIQRNPGSVLFIGLLALITFCVGLKSATIETDIEKLWVEVGGRLSKEIEYIRNTLGDGFGNTNQLIIQTPKNEKSNILHPNAMLFHLEALKVGTQVTVDMFEVTWRLKDICYSFNVPAYEEHLLDDVSIPCAIITPLDCFWEGSKLLGPDHDIIILNQSLKWTNFNPQFMLNLSEATVLSAASRSNSFGPPNRFPFDTFKNLMNRAGISTAYQTRPCLDPNDSECPLSAPNKNGREPDVAHELNNGCYGFASRWMHWPEELIIGGIKKNKTGHIVKASALQSIIQLMAEQDMFEYWKPHYKVHNIDWSVEKARMVLEAWQRKFAHEVEKYIKDEEVKDYHIEHFTNVALLDIMRNFSRLSIYHLLIGYCVILIFVATVRSNPADCVQSNSVLSVIGVLIVALSTASGLGFCAILGLPFNASTTQIIPFIALTYGSNFLFLIIDTYKENLSNDTPHDVIIAETLKQIGFSIWVNAICVTFSFGAAAIIPVPALRFFTAQTTILIAFVAISLLTLFPAAIKLDLHRQRSERLDIFCCIKNKKNSRSNHHKISRPYQYSSSLNRNNNKHRQKKEKTSGVGECAIQLVPTTQISASCSKPCRFSAKKEMNLSANSPTIPSNSSKKHPSTYSSYFSPLSSSASPTYQPDTNQFYVDVLNIIEPRPKQSFWQRMTLTNFADTVYIPLILSRPFKLLVILLSTALMSVCLTGFPKVHDGMDLTDIIPRDTSEYRFLHTQKRFFNVYNMYTITQGNFEYPNNQKLLFEYHAAFTRVAKIIKNDDGGLPDFWLSLFREWLISLQNAFDADWRNGSITKERWFPNASADGILAYKLLVQTGRVDNPVDKSLVTRVRLVDEKGIINPKAFYNYLTAWTTNDALGYSSSQANFHPEPRDWIHIATDYELKIPKSQPLVYAQIPFYLKDLKSNEDITATIKEVRMVCRTFEERGLPNFPTGLPFTYWEQYIRLRLFLSSSFVVVFSIIFLFICIILFNPWAASILVITLALNVAEIFGIMGLIGIQLSAVPAVILVVSVGKGSNLLVHILISFLTSIGKRNDRISLTFKQMFRPLVMCQMSSFLGIGMLAFSEFDFIVRDFFFVFSAEILVSSFNGFLLFPTLLSLIGPSSDMRPFEHEDRISTPSPPNTPPIRKKQRGSSKISRGFPRVQSGSLSTISEERSSFRSSHEIVVQPELVVETTTVTNTTPQQVMTQTTSTNLNNDKLSSDNSASDRDSPESGLSRDSPASQSDSGASTLSHSSYATSTINPMTSQCPFPQQTVTTKVTTTAKLKVELHAPYKDREFSSNSRNRTKERRPSRS
ncbi:protein patched isoform X2 [Brevipalpus obovatus]|uniref:protein patched isoform X2 n=1 Tax=Brevipalpus obovatus TaxID=246614 RepID=UPI003D9EC320